MGNDGEKSIGYPLVKSYTEDRWEQYSWSRTRRIYPPRSPSPNLWSTPPVNKHHPNGPIFRPRNEHIDLNLGPWTRILAREPGFNKPTSPGFHLRRWGRCEWPRDRCLCVFSLVEGEEASQSYIPTKAWCIQHEYTHVNACTFTDAYRVLCMEISARLDS